MLLIVFVHYNAKNDYDDYIDYYLDALINLDEEKEITFVSTSTLPKHVRQDLTEKKIKIIERENVGYDFYSYKLAIQEENIKKFSSVLICNDSVFGPFKDLNEIYRSMQNSEDDIIGMTQNHEHTFHIQSYFLLFKKSVIHTKIFEEFWDSVDIISNRAKVIEKYELGLSKFFIKHNFKLGAYCDLTPDCTALVLHSEKRFKMFRKCIKYFFKRKLSRIQDINVTHLFWKYLIKEYNFPFVKRELIDKNPEKLFIEKLPDEVEKLTNYPSKLFLRK